MLFHYLWIFVSLASLSLCTTGHFGAVFSVNRGRGNNEIFIPVGIPINPESILKLFENAEFVIPRVIRVKTPLRLDDMREVKKLVIEMSRNGWSPAVTTYFPLLIDDLATSLRSKINQGYELYEKLDVTSVYSLLANQTSVLIYWTHESAKSKRRFEKFRSFYASDGKSGFYLGDKEVILYEHEMDKEPVASVLQALSATWTLTDSQHATLNFDLHAINNNDVYSIRFPFAMNKFGSWSLMDVSMELPSDVIIPMDYITGGARASMLSPYGFCFACEKSQLRSQFNATSSIKYRLVLKKLKIQPFNFDGSFSARVNDCVGFFTPVIWSGIVVSITFITVLMWAMWMMMSIEPIQRFDNPRQKPLAIHGEKS